MAREIVARFYFEENDDQDNREDRINKTMNLFTSVGGETVKVSWGDNSAVVIGSFEADPAKLHHSFESKIIKPYPLGLGAGELSDATHDDLKPS